MNPMDKSDGVALSFNYTKYNKDTLNNTPIRIPTAVDLIVKFNELYLYNDAIKLLKREPDWGKAQEDFYKEFTIKEIYIYIPETE